jgi:hypothetical protein
MEDNLIPPSGPANECNGQPAHQDASGESSSDPIKKVPPLGTDRIVGPDSMWLPLGLIDAGFTLLFWGFSEFFGNHNAPVLSNVFFFFFVASVLAGLAGFVFKHWPNKIVIFAIYVAMCGISGLVIYEYSFQTTPPSTAPQINIKGENNGNAAIQINPTNSPITQHISITNIGSVGRAVSKEQMETIRQMTSPGLKINIISMHFGEPEDFAAGLQDAFAAAGASVSLNGNGNMIENGSEGLHVRFDHNDPRSLLAGY